MPVLRRPLLGLGLLLSFAAPLDGQSTTVITGTALAKTAIEKALTALSEQYADRLRRHDGDLGERRVRFAQNLALVVHYADSARFAPLPQASEAAARAIVAGEKLKWEVLVSLLETAAKAGGYVRTAWFSQAFGIVLSEILYVPSVEIGGGFEFCYPGGLEKQGLTREQAEEFVERELQTADTAKLAELLHGKPGCANAMLGTVSNK